MLVIAKAKADPAQLLDPTSSPWRTLPATTISLQGTPLGTQPTSYTRVRFKGRKVGMVSNVRVRACHDGKSMFVHLQWADPTADQGEQDAVFPDGAAVVFPVGSDAPINTMGNAQQAVNAWQWRADVAEGRSVVAHGLGTTEATTDRVSTKASYAGGRWQVVIARDLRGVDPGKTSVSLTPGGTTRLGVAVWEGSNAERAGFKAYTQEWTDVRLAAAE